MTWPWVEGPEPLAGPLGLSHWLHRKLSVRTEQLPILTTFSPDKPQPCPGLAPSMSGGCPKAEGGASG